jgi:hypothetical protein
LEASLGKVKTGGVTQGLGPEFKPQYHKKQTNKRQRERERERERERMCY